MIIAVINAVLAPVVATMAVCKKWRSRASWVCSCTLRNSLNIRVNASRLLLSLNAISSIAADIPVNVFWIESVACCSADLTILWLWRISGSSLPLPDTQGLLFFVFLGLFLLLALLFCRPPRGIQVSLTGLTWISISREAPVIERWSVSQLAVGWSEKNVSSPCL